jgi:hypothetical protein
MPQGSRKPRVVLIPRPVKMGKVSILAAFVAPPVAFGAGIALLKENTVSCLRASPVSKVSPWVKSRWNRLIAVGAVKRSRKSWAWSLVGAGADGAEVVEVDGRPWGKAWTEPKAAMARMTSLVKLIIADD